MYYKYKSLICGNENEKVKSFITLLLCMCCLISCSSDNHEEPQDIYTYQRILGKWEVYEWLNKDEYVPMNDGSFFSFYEGAEYVFYNAVLDKHLKGNFAFNPESSMIHLNGKKAITIKATFINENHAIFVWYYDVLKDDITIVKVRRLR